MEIAALLRDSMRGKIGDGRENRRVCSTPGPDMVRMNYNESPYGMSPRAGLRFCCL